jgi:hypothetical protein
MKETLTDVDLLRMVPKMLEEKHWQYFRAVKSPEHKPYVPGKMPETITEDYIFTGQEIIKALWDSWQAKLKGDNHVRENVSIRSESVPVVSTEVLAQEDKQDKP